MSPKRLVLFVEGHGDLGGAQVVVNRLLNEIQAWDCLYLDPNPFRMGSIAKITGRHQQNWIDKLAAAGKRGNVGGILLLLDGDADRVEAEDFCPVRVAQRLCERATPLGAGKLFSLACVFAMREFESWLIAGFESLPDRTANAPAVPENIESKRDAKGWLRHALARGYKSTLHQAELARSVDLGLVRSRNVRSFARLEHAIHQLVDSVRNNKYIATP